MFSDRLSIFDPASPPANSIRHFFVLVLVILGVIFVLVEGALLYCVFRFRKRAALRLSGAAAGVWQPAD